jgi:TolB protein
VKRRTRCLIWAIAIGLLCNSLVAAQDDSTNASVGLSGRIAYIGADYNVYHLDLENNRLTRLTDDAALDSDTPRVYHWPTWSADGRLAYFLTAREKDKDGASANIRFAAYISDDGIKPGRQAYSAQNENFQYAFWSPRNCSGGNNCRDLAVLLSGETDGLYLEILRDGISPAADRIIGTTVPPFYFSWSPDGTRMLWHSADEGLTIFDAANRETTNILPDVPGAFGAPAWSPVDDRLLYGTIGSSHEQVNIVIGTIDQTHVLVPDLTGPAAFSWSPDGNNVAYIGREGLLVVADTVTGEMIAQSSAADILAFFWSPDNKYIAYVTVAESPAFNASAPGTFPVSFAQQEHTAISLTWSVLTVETGTTRHYSTFQPTDEMLYLLRFFDQFAQSHRIWSPDSAHIVYSHFMPGNQPVISILDIVQVDSVPFTIATGVNAVWSFE